jgi:hypothetical protein
VGKLYQRIDPKLRFYRGQLYEHEEGRSIELKGGKYPNEPMNFDAAKNIGTDSAVGKTICAFLNSYLHGADGNGGSLFIGIHDTGVVHGIDVDKVKMRFGLDREIRSQEDKPWIIKQFFVAKGDKINIGDKVCEISNITTSLILHSVYKGKICSVYKNGVTGTVKNLKDEYLIEVELDSNDMLDEAKATGPNKLSDQTAPRQPIEIKQDDSQSNHLSIVTGIKLTRSNRDEIKRAIESSLLSSIQPTPLDKFVVLLHPVEDKPLSEPTPFIRGTHLNESDIKYIHDLEQLRDKLQLEQKMIKGVLKDTFIIEIRVIAADILHFYHQRPFIRTKTGMETRLMSLEQMKTIVCVERKMYK